MRNLRQPNALELGTLKYNGKVLLIVDQKLIAAFDTMGEAYAAALKTYVPGSFTLQPCSPDPDSYTLVLYSPFYSVIAV